MCGIAGVFGNFEEEKRHIALQKIAHYLAHRGPDGHKIYEHAEIGLVHTRLSIIDLSEAGNQPLCNEDGSLILVCNGEIYNYQELRQELLEKGHQFRSGSDCEVILHLYEEYKCDAEKVLNRLTGMFAFALWDAKRLQLFIARDRVGIKPLYYSRKGNQFIFCSEVRPIANCGLVDTNIDHTSLYEYFLTGSIPGPNTMWNEIKCLEPGYYAILRDSRMITKQYWDIPVTYGKYRSMNEVCDAASALLKKIIKDHLVADVPVGTFLSAGVDSSLITSIASEIHPGIHSFTASFPGEPEDEGQVAAASARKLGTTHHAFEISTNFFNEIEKQFQNIDQPFAISSALSLGRISALARQHVKVVLSGDGGDELFGGYQRHRSPAIPSFVKFIPPAIRNKTLQIGAKITRRKSLDQLRTNLNITAAQRFYERVLVASPAHAITFIHPDLQKKIDKNRYFKRIETIFGRTEGADELSRILYTDMKTTLPDEMLTKCDRMTMINGIEGRVPFLDHRMVELAFSVPAHLKQDNQNGKLPLRQMLAARMGQDLAFRNKTGFNSPLQQWLKSDTSTYNHALQTIHTASHISYLNPATIQSVAANMRNAQSTDVFDIVCLATYFNNNPQHFTTP